MKKAAFKAIFIGEPVELLDHKAHQLAKFEFIT